MNNESPKKIIPEEIKKAFQDADKYFPTEIQKMQFFDKYSRFNYDLGRRETWIETVTRSTNFLKELSHNKLDSSDYARVHKFILEMKVAPSMRLLAMAGPAARKQNLSIYNCSYLPMDSIEALVEELILSMSGTGVGFSVESKVVDKFPEVKMQNGNIRPMYTIDDSTEGWAEALRVGLTTWFNGENIQFDYSQIRPAGKPLKVKGGRASGPDPLKDLLDFAKKRILSRQGKKMRPIDVHDLACMVGHAAVSGGVRRTALISLFDMNDEEMRNCKNGDNLIGNEQRWNSNNSAVWNGDLNQAMVLEQMNDMFKGERGEPGIFSRSSANKMMPERRKRFGEKWWGTNPCGEIQLRPYQLCNLSIVIARFDDTPQTLKEKVEVATIIGTIQSMATNFPGMRDIWKKNCEEERLLGVDVTGQADAPAFRDAKTMEMLKQHAVSINKKYAEILEIPQSTSVTCVKPSGNSSQLFNCSSGLHARWSKHYIRNLRIGAKTPIYKVLKDAGVPMDAENGQVAENATTWVVHFPIKSPDGSITRKDRTAVEQCEYWLMNKLNWTEHNPSATISYSPNEVIDLTKWLWDHKDQIGGLSFLPASDAHYSQLPYEEISEEEYNDRFSKFPKIDFSHLYLYEHEDLTTVAQELSCVGKDSCELDFVEASYNE